MTVNTAQVQAFLQQVNAEAPQYHLDPAAALSVAAQEGLGGNPGDYVNGSPTSFGPFQLHIGGELPASVAALGADAAQQWAWSPAGISYALQRMGAVAGGLTGNDAIHALVTNFERPRADLVSGEISRAQQVYQQWVAQLQGVASGQPAATGSAGGGAAPSPSTGGTSTSTSPSTGGCDFTPTDCSQIKGPQIGPADLSGLAQTLCGIQNSMGAIGQFFCNLGTMLHYFTVKGHWWQIAFIAIGLILVGVGVVTYVGGPSLATLAKVAA